MHQSKYASLGDSKQERSYDRASMNHTPSKKDKYDSFTPRKRYIKEHDEYDNYRNFHVDQVQHFSERPSFQGDTSNLYNSRNRNPSIRRKEVIEQNENKKYELNDLYPSNFEKMYPTEARAPLNEYSANINCPTSIRKTKFKNYLESKDVCKRICFDETQNKDKSNIAQAKIKRDHFQNKQRFLDIQSEYSLTPRRLNKRKEENPAQMNQKLSMIQAKIARLERMTPKRYSTPKVSQVIQTHLPQFFNYQQHQQRQQPRPESIVSSRVSQVSQRQNQIMSRVSLGRLVQQQQCQTQIEVIQDLSYKISSKLRSIIRNFG